MEERAVVTLRAGKAISKRGRGKQVHVATSRKLHDATGKAWEHLDCCADNLNLLQHWTPSDKEFIEAKKYNEERKYRLAIDHLERLVVQRLFELQRCNVCGMSELYWNALLTN